MCTRAPCEGYVGNSESDIFYLFRAWLGNLTSFLFTWMLLSVSISFIFKGKEGRRDVVHQCNNGLISGIWALRPLHCKRLLLQPARYTTVAGSKRRLSSQRHTRESRAMPWVEGGSVGVRVQCCTSHLSPFLARIRNSLPQGERVGC